MKKNITVLSAAGFEWTDDLRRSAKACEGCKKPTQGRTGKAALCIDCAMGRAFKPVRVAIEEAFSK